VEPAAVQKSYLSDALSKGPGYSQKVKMGGKTYYMLVIQGGSVSRIPPHDTQKLQSLSETFFSAHQSADPEILSNKEISYIDSKGLHFSDGSTQTNSSVSPTESQKEPLFHEFDREKPQILQDYNQSYPRETPLASIRPQYHRFLDQNPNGKYSEPQIKTAIAKYAFYRLENVGDTVIKSNPRSKANIDQLFRRIDLNYGLERNLNFLSSGLKTYVTAQTIWETMTNIIQPPEVVYVPDPEDSHHEEQELILVRDSLRQPSSFTSSVIYDEEEDDFSLNPTSLYQPAEYQPHSSSLRADESFNMEGEEGYSSRPAHFSFFNTTSSRQTPRSSGFFSNPFSSRSSRSPEEAAPSLIPLTIRRNPRETKREELVRLFAILVTDIVIDKCLSPEEKKRAAEGLQHQLAGFLCIEEKDLPEIPRTGTFDPDQQILMKEILECMPEETKHNGDSIEKLLHIKRQLDIHARG